MSKITLDSVASGFDLSKINTNFQKIQTDLNDKVLYRNNPLGETNSLFTDVDVNGVALYNLPTPTTSGQAVPKSYVDSGLAGVASDVALVNQAVIDAQQAASDATTNGAVQVGLAAAQVALATAQVALANADVVLTHADVALTHLDVIAADASELAAANSAALAATYSSMGLGGASAFDFGAVTDLIVIFPTDWGTIV